MISACACVCVRVRAVGVLPSYPGSGVVYVVVVGRLVDVVAAATRGTCALSSRSLVRIYPCSLLRGSIPRLFHCVSGLITKTTAEPGRNVSPETKRVSPHPPAADQIGHPPVRSH